jgi:hypothetical protein
MIWALALTALSTLYSGYAANKSAGDQAALTREQGALQQEDYNFKASLALDEGYRVRQQQAMDYIGAGVQIQGTPLLMLLETKRKTEIESAQIRRTGSNVNLLAQKNATVKSNEGRSAMISSLFSAAGTVAGGAK